MSFSRKEYAKVCNTQVIDGILLVDHDCHSACLRNGGETTERPQPDSNPDNDEVSLHRARSKRVRQLKMQSLEIRLTFSNRVVQLDLESDEVVEIVACTE